MKGVKGIADAVEKMPVLRRVELNGNKFSEEDQAVDVLREALGERKEKAGVEDDDDENWGLDELDELDSEGEDEDEDEEAESDDEGGVAIEEKAAREVGDTQKAEEEIVAQEKDKKVDDLADMLGKTEIK